MKNSLYATYNNSEYRIGSRGDDWINLCSKDSNDLKNGFVLYEGIVYVKKVKINQLESVYSVKTYADYKGHKCQVIKEVGNKLLLHAMIGDYRVCEGLGFDLVDRGVYNKWVNSKDVEIIYEVREEISI